MKIKQGLCRVCGKTFEYLSINPGPPRCHCSDKCRNLSKHPPRSRIKIVVCKWCGNSFSYNVSKDNLGANRKYCSDACRHSGYQYNQSQYRQEHAEENSQYQKIYHRANKEAHYAYNRRRRQENPEAVKAYMKRYREDHEEELKQYFIELNQTPKRRAELSARSRRRRCLKQSFHQDGAPDYIEWERSIRAQPTYTCFYCSRELPTKNTRQTNQFDWLTVDHVVPLKLKGEDTRRNLVAACFYCNCVEKRDVNPCDWVERLISEGRDLPWLPD